MYIILIVLQKTASRDLMYVHHGKDGCLHTIQSKQYAHKASRLTATSLA